MFGVGIPELMVLFIILSVIIGVIILIVILSSRGQKTTLHNQLQSQMKEEFIVFTGENAHKYLPKFEKFNIGGVDNFSITWHWPAFFVGFWWMLYRKLYL